MNACAIRNPVVMVAALSLPLGYLLAPSSVTPLWLPLFLFIFLFNLKTLRLGALEILIFVLFPVYAVSLALVFNSSASFPLNHCISISICLIVYGVGKYLFSLANYRYAVAKFASSYWILTLIVALEVFVNSLGIDSVVPEFVRISGFSNFSLIQRVSGFWVEPGHLGIALNFLFPFVILSKALAHRESFSVTGSQPVSKAFFCFVFLIAVLCSLATGSSPTLIITIMQGLALYNPIITYPYVVTSFSFPFFHAVPNFFRKRSTAFLTITILLALIVIACFAAQDIKISSFGSYLFQLETGDTRDFLSAGDRATRIQWVINRIRQIPWGHGIAPYYRSGAETDFSNPIELQIDSSDVGYESSLSTPLDFALWAGPLWPILILSLIFIVIRRSLSVVELVSRQDQADSCAHTSVNMNIAAYSFVAMVSIVVSMIVRFCFVGNYFYPFLFLSVAFASRTGAFLSTFLSKYPSFISEPLS
jgi:hypothetical protein